MERPLDGGDSPSARRCALTVRKLNPNHQVVQALEGQWQKILALVLFKTGKVTITSEDMDKYMAKFGPEGPTIAVQGLKDEGLALWLMDHDEAKERARKEGGLPV